MTINSSGPVSLVGCCSGVSIRKELGLSGALGLTCASVRGLAGVASGAITMPTNFYGKSNASGFIEFLSTRLPNGQSTGVQKSISYNPTTTNVTYGLSCNKMAKGNSCGAFSTNSAHSLKSNNGSNTSNGCISYVYEDNTSNTWGVMNNFTTHTYNFGGTNYTGTNYSAAIFKLNSSNNLVSAHGYYTGNSCYLSYFYRFPSVAVNGSTVYAVGSLYQYALVCNGCCGVGGCVHCVSFAQKISFSGSTPSVSFSKAVSYSGYTWYPNNGGGGVADPAGNIYMYQYGQAPGYGFMTYVTSISSSGTLNWSKYYFACGFYSQAGYGSSGGPSMVDSSGNVYLSNLIQLGALSFDSSGLGRYSASVSTSNQFTTSGLYVDSSGNLYAAGYYYDNGINKSGLVKYNSSGILQWQYLFTASSGDSIWLSSITNISSTNLGISFTVGTPGGAAYYSGIISYPMAGGITGSWSAPVVGGGTSIPINIASGSFTQTNAHFGGGIGQGSGLLTASLYCVTYSCQTDYGSTGGYIQNGSSSTLTTSKTTIP